MGFPEKAALGREDKGAQRRQDTSVQGEAPQHRVKGRGRAANAGGRDGKGKAKCAGPPWPDPGSRAPHVNGEDRSLDIKRMATDEPGETSSTEHKEKEIKPPLR